VNQPAFVKAVICAGADAIQELSTYGQFETLREELIREANVPYGTVLTYEVCKHCAEARSLSEHTVGRITLKVLESQIKQGIDYTTVHASLTQDLLNKTVRARRARVIPNPSRAAGMLVSLMRSARIDNPLNKSFDRIASMCSEAGVTISLGSSFRPGAISDALDTVQRTEIEVQGHLTSVVRQAGGQVMVEGLSHALPSDLEQYALLVSQICEGAPSTALGPLPIDVAVGMDHIAAAVGICFASLSGISLVNVVTRKEHLAMPNVYDMVEAVRAARVGAYIGNVIRTGKQSERDLMMSKARSRLDWHTQSKLALFGEIIDNYLEVEHRHKGQSCSICGPKCPLLIQY
jgi:phosphomethylpyrimidine synthase